MFICKDCARKYDKKPEFCDCGSDEFIEEEFKPSIVSNNSDSFNGVNKLSKSSRSNSFSDERFILFIRENAPSLLIFFVCIILSIFILLIKDNTVVQKKDINNEVKSQKAVNWSIFEDNVEDNRVIKNITPKKNEVRDVLTNVSKKETVKSVSKVQKKSQTNNSVNVQQKKNIKKNILTTSNVDKQEKKRLEQLEILKQQKIDLENYKKDIAKNFYYKIDFSNVIGTGYCEVSFRVDSKGNITNKSFSKQSSNITLNDAVFYAIDNISRLQNPPEAYKKETLVLFVSFRNGVYSVGVK